MEADFSLRTSSVPWTVTVFVASSVDVADVDEGSMVA